MISRRPMLTGQDEAIKLYKRVKKDQDFRRALDLAEEMYRDHSVPHTVGLSFIDGVSPTDESAAKILALYLEAYAEAGTRFADVEMRLRESEFRDSAYAYLAGRSPEFRSYPLLARLRSRWGIETGTEPSALKEYKSGASYDPGLVIMPGKATEDMLARLTAGRKNSIQRVVALDMKHLQRIEAALPRETLDRIEFIRVRKVDPDRDETVFGMADAYADQLLEEMSLSVSDEARQHSFEVSRPALRTLARDALSAWTRLEHVIGEQIARLRPARITVLSDARLAAALATALDLEVCLFAFKNDTERLIRIPPHSDLAETIMSEKMKQEQRSFLIPEVDAGRQTVVAYVKASDRQALGNAEGFLPALSERAQVIVEPGWLTEQGAHDNVPELAESRLGGLIEREQIDIAWTTKGRPPAYWHSYEFRPPLEAAMKRLLATDRPVEVRASIISYAMSFDVLARTVREFCLVFSEFSETIERASSVIVCIGRTATPLALVSAARHHGVPSFEVQNGTISATGRFVPTVADRLFVLDEFSYRVFAEHMGTPTEALELIGSPRLESDLSNARKLLPAEAKRVLAGISADTDDILVLLATQPVDLDFSRALFDMAVKAVLSLGPKYRLMLRLHPNEGADYVEAYKDVLAALDVPDDFLLPSSQSGLDIQAADIILTYFSTIGLEGLSLGKRVISISPGSDEAPPFDLRASGAEGLVTNSRDLAEVICAGVCPVGEPGIISKASAGEAIVNALLGQGA